jgi:hypothetical protein
MTIRTARILLLAVGTVGSPLAAPGTALAQPVAMRTAGAHAGIWSWALPDTPGGTVPKQAWSGAGSGKDGEIYVGGMDHVANAALYRLGPAGGDLTQPGSSLAYVGDAAAASRAAGNLRPGEGIEKFHTQPQFHNGRTYVANMNYSDLDAGYTAVRGFHWYAYDRPTATFRDLSAGKPGGVAVANGGLPGMTVDRARGKLYGTVSPTGELVRYDIASGVTTRLGRPPYGRPYVYPGRALWVGSGGRVYFTAGNPATGSRAGGPYDPARFNHVRYWDPATGFGEQKTWALRDTRAIDYAQCFDTPAPRTCYLMDNVGRVYRFSENRSLPAWAALGDIGQRSDALHGLAWVFQVRADQKKAYIIARRGAFFEFDLTARRATLLGNLGTLEPWLAGLDYFGNHAWDGFGRFYFAAYPKDFTAPGRTRLVAIDPAQFLPAIR